MILNSIGNIYSVDFIYLIKKNHKIFSIKEFKLDAPISYNIRMQSLF